MLANAPVQTVLDTQAITTLLYRSLRYADEKRTDELPHCYADIVTIDFGGVKPSQQISAKDLAAWAGRAYALVKTQHMMFNVGVEVNGDNATSRSCGHALHERTDHERLLAYLPTLRERVRPYGRRLANRSHPYDADFRAR